MWINEHFYQVLSCDCKKTNRLQMQQGGNSRTSGVGNPSGRMSEMWVLFIKLTLTDVPICPHLTLHVGDGNFTISFFINTTTFAPQRSDYTHMRDFDSENFDSTQFPRRWRYPSIRSGAVDLERKLLLRPVVRQGEGVDREIKDGGRERQSLVVLQSLKPWNVACKSPVLVHSLSCQSARQVSRVMGAVREKPGGVQMT